jgi:uncharacterized protein YgiM (DUF1202 family)
LRQRPVDGNIIKLLSLKDILLVIEGGNAAAKIGQQSQWLQVRLSDNTEGYVAAWLVQQTEAPIMAPSSAPAASSQPAVAPTPPAAPTAVTVKTTTDQISLRSQPRVGSETFIRTLAKGTVLTVVDASGAAKIGQQNQWLQVRTAEGQEGYVAAWFVAKT